MNLPIHVDVTQYSRRARWIMGGAWILIAVKCVLVWWAIAHWNVPIHPMWIIAPTLIFAALATALWVTHHED